MGDSIHVDNFISGEWDRNTTNDRFKKMDPTSGRELAQVTESTDDDISKVVESAAAFHKSRAWADLGMESIDGIFSTINTLLQRRRGELVNALVSETGKSKKGAHDEVSKAIETFKAIQYQKYQAVGDILPSQDNDALVFTTRYPVGVTAAITPWNFPVYIGAQHLAPALMGRNTAILKCSPHTPISSSMLVEILLESGLPPEMISLIHGTRTEVVEALVSDKRVDMVSFTGSSEVAKEIAIKRYGRKFILEGGGNNFQVVLADSDLALASANAVKGAMSFSGQKCVATGNVLVEKAVLDDFLEKVKAIIEKMKTGDVNSGADIGPLVGERCDSLENLIAESVAHGGKLITGGSRVHPESTDGSFFYSHRPAACKR